MASIISKTEARDCIWKVILYFRSVETGLGGTSSFINTLMTIHNHLNTPLKEEKGASNFQLCPPPLEKIPGQEKISLEKLPPLDEDNKDHLQALVAAQNESIYHASSISDNGEFSDFEQTDFLTESFAVGTDASMYTHITHPDTTAETEGQSISVDKAAADSLKNKFVGNLNDISGDKSAHLLMKATDKRSTEMSGNSNVDDVNKSRELPGFECDICKKKFPNASRLKRHIGQVHKDTNTPFPTCEYCGQTFKRLSSRNNHMKLHTNLRPGTSVANGKCLMIIVADQGDGKQRACGICGKRCKRIDTLRSHIANHHSDYEQKNFFQNGQDQDVPEHTNDIQMDTEDDTKAEATSIPANVADSSDTKFTTNENMEICGDDTVKVIQGPEDNSSKQTVSSLDDCGDSSIVKDVNKIRESRKYNVKVSVCEICKKRFPKASRLKRHMRQVHDGTESSNASPRTCEYCGQTFKFKNSLRNHLKIHTNPKYAKSAENGECLIKFVPDQDDGKHRACGICGERFKRTDRLMSHISGHSEHKLFVCEICGKGFRTNAGHKMHVEAHKRTKSFQCEKCEKSFKYATSLQYHMEKHNDGTNLHETPFMCPICGKFFQHVANLSKHIKTHSDERPHKCSICDKTFKRMEHVRVHEQTHTEKIKSFPCSICGKLFTSHERVILHSKIHLEVDERPTFKCDVCDKVLLSSGSLKMHHMIHSGQKDFHCDVCDKWFSRLGNLENHMKQHTGERPFTCDICQRTFVQKSSMEKHRRTHTGERPFKCDWCSWAFTDRSNWAKHRKTCNKKNQDIC